MGINYRHLIFYALFILNLIIGIVEVYGDNMKITKEKAIEISNERAIELGYNVKFMNIKVSKHDVSWNEYLPKDSVDTFVIERQKKLKSRNYWAVYYSPISERKGEIIVGGDVCIFIDANTGEIITDIRWK